MSGSPSNFDIPYPRTYLQIVNPQRVVKVSCSEAYWKDALSNPSARDRRYWLIVKAVFDAIDEHLGEHELLKNNNDRFVLHILELGDIYKNNWLNFTLEGTGLVDIGVTCDLISNGPLIKVENFGHHVFPAAGALLVEGRQVGPEWLYWA